MTQSSTWVWFGLAAMVIGYLATWWAVFLVSESDMKAGGPQLIEAIEAGSNEVMFRVTTGLGLIGAGLLFVYAAGVRRTLRQAAPEGSLVPGIVHGAFLGTAVLLAAGFIARGMIFDSAGMYGDDPRIAFFVMGVDVPLAAWGLLGVAAAACAYGSFAMRILPRWFGVVSVIAAVLVGLIWLTGTPPPANIPVGIWLITSVFAFRGLGRESSVAMPAPAAAPAA